MDYLTAVIITISLTVIGAIGLYYGVKKNAGNFFSGEFACGIEIRQWRQRQYGLKMLKKRLEKGEITQEQYNELKKQFEQPSSPES